MPTKPLCRIRPLPVLLVLTATAACAPTHVRYPEPGEPGPAITAAGDTIPEGRTRDTFMAGYTRGFQVAEEAAGGNVLRFLGGVTGGFITGVTLPVVVSGGVFGAPYAAGGLGLVWLSTSVGAMPPMTRLPESVRQQGPDFEDGYREGYYQGLQATRRRAALAGAGVGGAFGVIMILALGLLPYT